MDEEGPALVVVHAQEVGRHQQPQSGPEGPRSLGHRRREHEVGQLARRPGKTRTRPLCPASPIRDGSLPPSVSRPARPEEW